MLDRRIKTDIPMKITCAWDEENAESIQKHKLQWFIHSTIPEKSASILPRSSLRKMDQRIHCCQVRH